MSFGSHPQAGFTLLELLLVVAILAMISGSLYVIYDPIEAKALKSRTNADFRTVEQSIRTFYTLSGGYPSPLENLVVEVTPSSPRTRAYSLADEEHQTTPLAHLPSSVHTQIGSYQLTTAAVHALQSSGINQISTVHAPPALTPQIHTIKKDDHVAAIQSGCQGLPLIEGFDFQNPLDSSILHHQLGLDPNKCHLVVAFGLGKQASLISNPEGTNPVSLSSTPHYLNLPDSSYTHYLLLFHVGTSSDATLQSSEIFPSARFAGVYSPPGSSQERTISARLP